MVVLKFKICSFFVNILNLASVVEFTVQARTAALNGDLSENFELLSIVFMSGPTRKRSSIVFST